MIEDSRESQLRFLESIPASENVELQAITVDPFFNDEIEQAIKQFKPDLIILDLRLKRDEDSGFRVLRKLKESSLRNIPVVVCSKYIRQPNDDNWIKAMRYGAAAALPKIPFPKIEEFFNATVKEKKQEPDPSIKGLADASKRE